MDRFALDCHTGKNAFCLVCSNPRAIIDTLETVCYFENRTKFFTLYQTKETFTMQTKFDASTNIFAILPTDNQTYTFEHCQANLDLGYFNLRTIWLLSTPDERKSGLAWYGIALYGCFYLSETYDLPLSTVVQVVACLSPQLRWTVNIQVAEQVIRHYLSGGYIPEYNSYLSKAFTLVELSKDSRLPRLQVDGKGTNVTGANLIKSLWICQGYDALSGPKVLSFADNIFRFLESDRVTVDSHAINAWFGVTWRQSVALAAPSFYKIIAADYIRLAKEENISPLECQAIIWVVLRRLSGSDKQDGVIPDRFIPTPDQMRRMVGILEEIFPPTI